MDPFGTVYGCPAFEKKISRGDSFIPVILRKTDDRPPSKERHLKLIFAKFTTLQSKSLSTRVKSEEENERFFGHLSKRYQ